MKQAKAMIRPVMLFLTFCIIGSGLTQISDAGQTNATEALMANRVVNLTQPYPQSYKNAETDKISVQYAVIEISQQVGLGYEWVQSQKNASPECRRWIRPSIKNKPFREAIKEILGPIGLKYEIRNSKVILMRK